MHDLCLAIGGMTVTELRERMTYAELTHWYAYAEENGPLNPMIRTDAAVARAVLPFVRDGKMRDFMPWPKELDVEATPEDFMTMLKSAKR